MPADDFAAPSRALGRSAAWRRRLCARPPPGPSSLWSPWTIVERRRLTGLRLPRSQPL